MELRLFREMLRIRRVEEAIADEYPKKEMRCPVHLSIGQEAVPVAISAALSHRDAVYSTHRCHAHYLAKGGSLPRMMAELFGKVTGCCKGKGGSMHLVDVDVGMMGSSALVGGTIPLAAGHALAFKLSHQPLVAVAYFGDGATEEGLLYESLNFASLHRLPVIFVVENNLYATYSHQSKRQANLEIWRRGETFGVPGVRLNGNDVEEVYQGAAPFILRARQGEGPALLECLTYRHRDHVGPSPDIEVGYRTQEEVDAWLKLCPLKISEARLRDAGKLSDAEMEKMEREIANEIAEAFTFARQSPAPEPHEVFTDIYARA